MKVNDLDAILAQPIDSALKVYGLSHYNRADSKLANQSAAVPAGGEGRDHGFVAVGSLAARSTKRVGFPMRRRIPFLHAAIVALAEERSFASKESRANGDSSLGKSCASF